MMRLVLLGPPGAGKGTQAAELSKKFGWRHISTGNMLREAVKNKTTLGAEAKKYMDSGELVPDNVVTKIVVERINAMQPDQGFILDGYPRTEAQARWLEDALRELHKPIDKVIYFETSPEVSITRLSGRRVCRKCGANYHIKNIPAKKAGVCDKCGAELFQRDDDKEETVRNRLRVYEEQTQKLLFYYKGKGMLEAVSGDLDVDTLFNELSALFRRKNFI